MNKLTLFVTVLCFIGYNNVAAQSIFQKTFGGIGTDSGESVKQTNDGGYIIAGTTESSGAGGSDVYVVKTDSSGDSLWTNTFGGTSDDYGHSVQQTSDGGYIIAGSTNSFGAGGSDVYVVKTDSNGDTLWTKTFGGAGDDWGFSVQQTSDGGYIIAGSTNSFGAGFVDVYLIKTNGIGDTLWTKTYGGVGYDVGLSVQQTNYDGYILIGSTLSYGAGDLDVYLIKTDGSGETLWTKTFGGIGSDSGYSVQHTSDSGYIIAGNTNSFGAGSWDVYLIKTDGSGNTLWSSTFGGIDQDRGQSVRQTSDSGYIIAGTTISFGAGIYDVYLIKIAEGGNIVSTMNEQTSDDFGVLGYPNPTTNALNVSTTFHGNEAIHYQIITTLGATAMANKAAAKDFSVDVSSLPSGIYFIRLQSGNAQVVKRFVKE